MTIDGIVNGVDGLNTQAAALVGAIKTIQAAARELAQAERVRASDNRNRNQYIIWQKHRHSQISDYSEVAGLFYGTYEEADAILEKLGSDFYRTEPTVMTAANVHEWTDQ
jgi:hypothetical protein